MPLLVFVLLCAEVAGLIKLGQAVGGAIAFVEILATGAVGLLLLRSAGRAVFRPDALINLLLRPPTLRTRQPAAALLLGSLLLVLPGLLTDAAGVVLIARYFVLGGRLRRTAEAPKPPGTIDVEFRVHDDVSDE